MFRTDLLVKIVRMEKPWRDLVKKLEHFGWDSKKELVVFKKEYIIHILQNFINGKLNNFDIEEWANIIEGRDDIGFENTVIKQYLEELANPLLTEKLTKERAKHLIKKISSDSDFPVIF